jgi:hypothetical protein
VKDEKGDLLAESHNILNRWKNYFSQLLNMHNVIDVRQTEVHTTEPLVPDPSRLVVEISFVKLKTYKLPGSDQIQPELIQTGGEILLSAIHKLINSGWNKEELPDQWKKFTIRVTKQTVIIIVVYYCYQLRTKSYQISSSQHYVHA